MNYHNTAEKILANVGGSENISHLEHCSTRLRFTLIDDNQANITNLEKIEGVIGVRQNVQCQVIIGNDVVEVYDEVQKLIAASGGTSKQTPTNKPKQKIGNIILDFIISVFQPLVPAIAGGGILKSMLLLLALVGWIDNTGQTYKILNMIGTAPLYFLPILVALTTANKLKVNSLVAISAVSTLILPEMSALLAEGTSLLGFDVQNIAYASQVFPAILSILFYAQIEKFFTKYSPKAIRIFFVPMMSLLITVPITLLILGPIGFTVGKAFAAAILFLFAKLGWVAVALLATFLPFMVVTGMHKAMVPYAVTTMGELGKEVLYLPASLAHNIAEAGACFAVAIRSRDKDLKSTAISAGISALFGITEPALYGVTILNKRVLYSVMIGSFVGGAFVGIFAVESYVTVGPGLASLSMFISPDNGKNIIYALAGVVISFVVSFIAAMILWQEKQGQGTTDSSEETDLAAALVGKVIPLTEVNDEVFSNKLMGEGIAIVPESGILYAPSAAKVEMLFDTNHAIGLTLANGEELLIHVGLDTVQLKGQYFTPLVKKGEMVNKGDKLLEFDLEKIIAAGFDPTTVIVVTNHQAYEVKTTTAKEIDLNESLMTIKKIGV